MSDALRSAAVIQVIQTTETRGNGVPEDPIRIVTKYWTLEGELLAENDSLPQAGA